ncbi:hypothetical protein IAR55_002560 [Kwoniella newhampshirensis]|uniref:Hemolysin n=1 Tax=Kwoniella newhampshirensis TaxID=1651941 RepID=A0AAW0Z1T5_9TREE
MSKITPPSSPPSPPPAAAAEPSSSSTPNSNPRPSAPSPWRRVSHPTLPIPAFLPNTNFRAALLGYLGEIEVALRNRLVDSVPAAAGTDDSRLRKSASPSASVSGEEWGTSATESNDDDGNAFSTALSGPSSDGARQRRNANPVGSSTASVFSTEDLPSSTFDAHIHLLNHLSALREEALNYLPSLSVASVSVHVPTMPLSIPNREWLRSLPSRLSMVDPGLTSIYGKGKERVDSLVGIDNGSIEGARQKVVDLVHAMLPSEEWGGWEKLGWEEQEDLALPSGRGRRARSASLDRRRFNNRGDDDEEEEEEPEYLFPNRTPASTRALARRRAVRSKSLGANSFPTSGILGFKPPKFERSKTDPFGWKSVSEPLNISDSENQDDDDDDDQPAQLDTDGEEENGEVEVDEEYILTHPDAADTKLTKLAAKDSEIGPSVQEALKMSEDGRRLLTFDDLPPVWRNNEHIITGYRFIPLHLKTGPVPLIKSAFIMHNETVNIHSHSIPTILILFIIPLIIYRSPLPNAHPLDTASLVSYLLAAASCMSSSAGWHVLSGCASKKWFEWGACVDWLIAASFGTVVYNGFYCQPKTVLFYCTTNLLCGALGSYLPFQKWFNERRNKHLRIAFFLFLCFAMVAPMVQMFYQHGWSHASTFVAPFGLSIMTYITGLIFYAFHFPECKWPGKFDTWGASHQIWHAAIVLAIILHYRAIFVAHSVKFEYSCMSSGAGKSISELLDGFLGLTSV